MKRVIRYRLTAGACGLLAAYLVLALAAAQQQFLPLDRSVRAWVQPLRSGWLDVSMAAVSFLGEPAGLIPLILIASAFLWRASRRWALLLPALMAGTGVLQLVGKWAANRPRPNAAPWGFPSGHVLSLAVFFGTWRSCWSRCPGGADAGASRPASRAGPRSGWSRRAASTSTCTGSPT